MSFLQAIILSFIQGIAEFLPISSSGHLNLAQYFFKIEPSLNFRHFSQHRYFFISSFFLSKTIKIFFYQS